MKIPKSPPPFNKLFADLKDVSKMQKIVGLSKNPLVSRHYLHWEKLRHHKIKGHTAKELWLAVKLQRFGNLKSITLHDKKNHPFKFCTPELVLENLHRIDVGAGAAIGVPEPITNPQTKDKYLIRSLMEEAITSSQLEEEATNR